MVAEMIEDYDWESDEAEDWESDEAFAESEDSVEDIGERTRRTKQRGRTFQPVRGRRGFAVRRPNGTVSKVPFPAPLATAAETNRGLAKQELLRRELAQRLKRVETMSRVRQKKDGSVSSLVTLAIGGGLAGFGAIQAGKDKTASGNLIGRWAAQRSAQTAALVWTTQLATSGAKLVVGGGYDKGPINVTSDIVAATLLAAFAFGSFHTPGQARSAANFDEADRRKGEAAIGDIFVTPSDTFQVIKGVGAELLLRKVA